MLEERVESIVFLRNFDLKKKKKTKPRFSKIESVGKTLNATEATLM